MGLLSQGSFCRRGFAKIAAATVSWFDKMLQATGEVKPTTSYSITFCGKKQNVCVFHNAVIQTAKAIES